MCKQRLIKSMVKTRNVQQLEDFPRVKKARIQFTIEKLDPNAEKDDLKNLVFHHFEEREFGR
ncbi:hypothetical protein PsorP6_018422 [Peronosclerospora sorghi]|nr:hypothetical protein PsorP6_018401 [Peronosclerospora sorghi]KAI9895233.1 hypothetical protein PsorP6_018422 [Peronosclerospora sorghi]